MRESVVEKELVRSVRLLGGVCYKWVSPGTTGVPDRIVILPGGRVHFVELKTDTGEPSARQLHVIETLNGLGVPVHILYGLGDVREFMIKVAAE